jgi:PAS domain S-box-containing protein
MQNTNPKPSNEEKRLEALRKLNILDSMPEKQFDDITRLASIICGTPMTLITLIDENRQWFKSRIGIEDTETPRDVSFCRYAIMDDKVFEVENALKDPRFVENPFVTDDPNVRFYAGAPLTTREGYNIGTLCVLDVKPNKLTDEQREALGILAKQVATNMELRKDRNNVVSENFLIHESNELLNAFIENSPSMVSMKDLDGRYIYVNSNAARSIGKNVSELIGLTVYDLRGKEIGDEITKNELNVKQERKTTRHEYHIEDKYYISYNFPLINKENEVYGVGTISNDISLAKKNELALQKSNKRFLSIFNNSSVGMVISALGNRKIVHVNKAFLDTFHYSSEQEIIGSTFSDLALCTDKETERVARLLQQKGLIINEEVRCTAKDNTELTILCSVNLIDMDDDDFFLVSYIDITERKRLELQLVEAKKVAEQATVSKSSFLANMSHEIRTPLNAMIGFADLLDTTPLNAQQKEYLSAINVSGKNLLTIINDILDFSKIEAGMLSIEKIPFSPQQLIHSVYTMFFRKAQGKNIKLFNTIDPAMPALVKGDPTRLNQIMINLIGNAIKFTNEGSVSVDAEVLEKSNQQAIIRISVKDTGIGIAPEKLFSIFERFTQAESDTTRSYGGTGLGLSIAKKLVELQGGTIRVNSVPEKGSEFSFVIPFEIADEQEYKLSERADEKPAEVFSGKKVLVVEDNILNQKLAQAVLAEKGFEVEIAANGQIAVDVLKKKKYDIILMDIQMPVLDGYEATKVIRHELKDQTPVIAMTANAMAGERERCISNGMDEYITKPFNAEVLYKLMGKFLNTKPLNEEAVAVTKVTDLAYLKEFSGNKTAFLKEMIDTFLEQNPKDIEILEEALKTKDFAAVKALSHSLQTSLGFVGFSQALMDHLKEAEALATGNSGMERIGYLLGIIIESCRQAQRELKEETLKLK